MLETSDQIANPVLAGFPVPEVSQPEIPSQAESVLTAEIIQLWQVHRDYQSAIKNETQKFRSLRDELGKRLAEMKEVLAKPGRNGQWSSWLKEREIPRATADRLVARYQRSLIPPANCLTEQLAEPSEGEIQKLFFKVFPKLRRVLRTPQSLYRFVDLLTLSCDGAGRRVTEEGILVMKPSQDAMSRDVAGESVDEHQTGFTQPEKDLDQELM